MFLLDDFVVTTDQQTNLKFLVRLEKSPSEAFCMLQHFYKEQSLSRSTVFLWHKRFKEGRYDVEDDPRCGTTLVPCLCISRSSVIICRMLFRFNRRSIAHLTDHLHASSSLQARHWFHFYLWKAFHTWDHP